MAFVYRRKRVRYWRMCWTDADGKEQRASSKSKRADPAIAAISTDALEGLLVGGVGGGGGGPPAARRGARGRPKSGEAGPPPAPACEPVRYPGHKLNGARATPR